MMYFKIITFEKENQISIDETELETALRAQATGRVAFCKNGSIAGNHIISVLPDYDKADKVYNPSGEDYLPPRIKDEHHLAIQNAEETIRAQSENRKPQLKERNENPVKIHTQGLTSLKDLLPPKND